MQLVCALALCAGLGALQEAPQDPGGSPAAFRGVLEPVLAQLQRVPLLGMAEHHRSAEVHAFLLALIEHPRFGSLVDDIVVEFGNALHQPLMDRYVAGESVAPDELRRAWRDTGQWLVWDSPLYEQFFARVRAANLARPPEQRVRVLLGDPPIDWAKVASAADYRAFAERDAFYAGLVVREVLERDRRALLVIGGMHLARRGPLDPALQRGGPSAGALLERSHPGALHIVWTVSAAREQAAELGFERAPAYLDLRTHPLGDESYGRLLSGDLLVRIDGEWKPMGQVPWPPMRAVVDSLLYLGPGSDPVLPDPALYREPLYQAELRRRAGILREVYGMDFLPELEQLLGASEAPGPR
jgi:hypothetical protein